MSDRIRIGTRSSQLAVWQASHVAAQLDGGGHATELVPLKSEGDLDLKTPLYEMGVQGIFTRTLDLALLHRRIDLAVHSMKDVPTRLPDGLVQAAVLPRASSLDILVQRDPVPLDALAALPAVIATSSTRRRAQWLRRFPHHQIVSLRGNVNSRLQKIAASDWQGGIFAAAGLERINLCPPSAIALDWMLPAPAQGAIVVVCRDGDAALLDACQVLHDPVAALCTQVEKDFLRALRGGCTAPIGALARVSGDRLYFTGNLLVADGSEELRIERDVPLREATALGQVCGQAILEAGGEAILEALGKRDDS